MEWFNVFGLVFISAIMVPNIIFLVTHKGYFVIVLKVIRLKKYQTPPLGGGVFGW